MQVNTISLNLVNLNYQLQLNNTIFVIRIVLRIKRILSTLQLKGKMNWILLRYIVSQRQQFLQNYATVYEQLGLRNSLNDHAFNITLTCLLRYVFEKQDQLNNEILSFSQKTELLKSDCMLATLLQVASDHRNQEIMQSKLRAINDYIAIKLHNPENDALFVFDEECTRYLLLSQSPVFA